MNTKNIRTALIACALLAAVLSCQTGPGIAGVKSFAQRIADRETPPIYKDWNNYPDIKGLDKYQLIAKLSVSWDSIEPKGDSAAWGVMGTALGLEWARTSAEYPMLTKEIINVEAAKKAYDAIHRYNPNIMLGVEVRWDAVKEFELPPDHRWWKRDANGERIKYAQSTPQRYEINVMDPEYIAWTGERIKAILDTGVVDFILLDHIKYMQDHGGDPLPFVKGVREKVGPDAILLGNVHFSKMPEFVKYIDAFGEEEYLDNPLDSIAFWENTGRQSPRFHCWEFVGLRDNLKAMRFYTTLVMTTTNSSLRYIDHGGSTTPSIWYEFWDVKIGKAMDIQASSNNCFVREYTAGTTICNYTNAPVKLAFPEPRQRASTGEKAGEFILDGRDGDMFLFEAGRTAVAGKTTVVITPAPIQMTSTTAAPEPTLAPVPVIPLAPVTGTIKVAYVTDPGQPAYAMDSVLAALKADQGFTVIEVNGTAAGSTAACKDADLVIIAEMVKSGAAGLNELRGINKPLLMMKIHQYKTSSTTWSWLQSSSIFQDATGIKTLDIMDVKHPIFSGITGASVKAIAADAGVKGFVSIDVAGITGVTGGKIVPLATVGGQPSQVCILEITPGTMVAGGVVPQKYLQIGITGDSYSKITPDGLKIIKNACFYLVGKPIK